MKRTLKWTCFSSSFYYIPISSNLVLPTILPGGVCGYLALPSQGNCMHRKKVYVQQLRIKDLALQRWQGEATPVVAPLFQASLVFLFIYLINVIATIGNYDTAT